MTETLPPASSPSTRLTPVPRVGESAESFGDSVALAELGCRLARQLFDAGLRLDSLHAVFDRPNPSVEELRTANRAVGDILDQLSSMLHDTGKTILADAIDRIPHEPVQPDWLDPVRRTRRKL
ncbi:hypothetical protein [Nocardia sp. BMG111209]|uniref:hypothetical protein n=1 Tax=Nocardia sp. BMG111209 TaxID=1160137 RepID=UPI00035F5708|nr:hypothetical protein [Nocardia sp. BMG111209]